MTVITQRKLLQIFVTEDVLEEAKIEEIIKNAEDEKLPIDQFMVQRGYLSEKQFLDLFAHHVGYEYLETLEGAEVPVEFCRRVNINFSRANHLIAIGLAHGRYRVATCSPLITHPIDELGSLLGAEIDTVLAPKAEIINLLNNAYKQNVGSDDLDFDSSSESVDLGTDGEREDLLDDPTANTPPVIRTVRNILRQAFKYRVSDIHLQPYEEKMQVRYRIDGILYDRQSIPKKYQDAIISRIKVLGEMDIAERRLPQDGRKGFKMGEAEVDVRISSVPTSHGERIVMRLLDKSSRTYDLEEIGLSPLDRKMMNQFIQYTHGIILVTGPTGSGKSTTLYSAISGMNALEKNIMTIEDPIEYDLRNISQIQVHDRIGLSFSKGLRTLLRQDPDVIMVGEIRDEDTARTAIQAALTGHLVLSTLHTNDSASAVTRLLDIGIEPYLVSSSVVCVVAQRLIRKICDGCKVAYDAEPARVKSIGLSMDDLENGKLWRGEGCEKCMGTGYQSRVGIYEILPITEPLRELIINREGASIIKNKALSQGLRTLRKDGARKVLEGITTIDEILRVTQTDVFDPESGL